MPIPIITNFSVNAYAPIDDRMIATSSAALNNIHFKYEGLTVYRTDTKLNYVYTSTGWQVASNGIYGGNGKLGNSTTTVDFGTVSTTLNANSSYLSFNGFSKADGNAYVRLENYFYRNKVDDNGLPETVSYRTQFRAIDLDEGSDLPGPYIIFNPPNPIFTSRKGGGISFGTMNPNDSNSLNERLRLEGTGLVRFKLNTSTSDSSKSINLGIDSSNTKPFIGYNWTGQATELVNPDRASYIEFNDNIVGIYHASGNGIGVTTGTHSMFLSQGTVVVNGQLNVTNYNFITNRSIGFGANDGNVHYCSSDGNGIKFDSSKQYAALVYRSSVNTIRELLTWNSTGTQVIRPISFTQSATITTYGTFNARYETNIWDNDFNPDRTDSSWIASGLSGDNVRQTATSNTVIVSIDSSTNNQFKDFKFTIKATYTASTKAKAAYLLSSRPYDRYLYLYSDSTGNAITHVVELYLANPDLNTRDEAASFVKVGHITTGNRPNYNDTTTNNNASYQIKHYGYNIIIPANMIFKIKFTFPHAFTAQNDSAHWVRARIIRSGKWLAPGSSLNQPEPLPGEGISPDP